MRSGSWLSLITCLQSAKSQRPSLLLRGKIFYVSDTHGDPDTDRCNALWDAGFEVTAIQWLGNSQEYIWDTSIQRKYALVTLGQGVPGVFGTCVRWVTLAKVLRGQSSCVIFYGYQKLSFWLLAVCLAMTGRTLLSINDSKFDDYRRTIWRDVVKVLMLRPYAGFLAATERAKSYLEYLGCRNIALYYCAVDLTRLTAPSTQIRQSFQDRSFIMVARFIPKKRHAALLEEYEKYAAMAAEPRRLVLVGYGPLEQDIRAQIYQSQTLKKLVDLVGYRSSKDIRAMWGRALCLILPSDEEQFGIVVTEALANNIPVIASAACGAADLIKNGINGYTFRPDRMRDVGIYLALLAERESLWASLSANCRASAEEASTDKFVIAVENLIQGLK